MTKVDMDVLSIGDTPFAYIAKGSAIYVSYNGGANKLAGKYTGSHTALAVTNGGTFPDNNTLTAGMLATPQKEGYIFDGWYDNADLTGDKVTTPTAGITYYAKWNGTSGICGDPTVNDGNSHVPTQVYQKDGKWYVS